MKKKTTYRIRNWKEYNAALRRRGSLTVWITDDVRTHWRTEEKTGRRGASDQYTDLAIETMATVQAIYSLAGRQTEGFLASVFKLLRLDLPVPDHSTLSRRRSRLTVTLPLKRVRRARHVVVDSTGVKVYGEGEWKVRQHGWSKRRTWRKLHLCVDEATKEIVSACASTNDVSDDELLPEMLQDVPGEVEQVSGDGSYDKRKCYEAISGRKARAAIPPRKGARIWQHGNCKATRHARDENLRRIRAVGRKQWKRESGYHRRSLAETTVFRFKVSFGERLQTRRVENQFSEMFIKCAALNRMVHLGMPQSHKVTG
ncbi:MAG: IS5 family transposase [Blastocatellia bacterium]